MVNKTDMRDYCEAVNVDLKANQATITFSFGQIIELRKYLQTPYIKMLEESDGVEYDGLTDSQKMLYDLYELVDDSYIRLSQQFGVDVPIDLH